MFRSRFTWFSGKCWCFLVFGGDEYEINQQPHNTAGDPRDSSWLHDSYMQGTHLRGGPRFSGFHETAEVMKGWPPHHHWETAKQWKFEHTVFFGVFPLVSHFCWSLPNCSCLLFDFCGCLAQNRLCINTNHNVNPTKYASRHEDLETIRHCSFELPMFQHYRLKILNWVFSFQVRKFFSNCLSLKIETSHQWVFCTAT